MRREDIIGLIGKPKGFLPHMLEELKSLKDEYPYFQTAQLLYTLNLHAEKDSRFPSELRKTASYLPDRGKLFFLIEETDFPSAQIQALESQDEVVVYSPFDLIDAFLSENKKTLASKKTNDANVISTDYISYFLSQNSDTQEQEVRPMRHQKTIDRFLDENEKSPIRIELKETEETELIPDLDTIEEDSFFSETLAKIYLKQKKYDKALEIIRQLYLRNPEKNRYFADQIRFLEKLIINVQNK